MPLILNNKKENKITYENVYEKHERIGNIYCIYII